MVNDMQIFDCSNANLDFNLNIHLALQRQQPGNVQMETGGAFYHTHTMTGIYIYTQTYSFNNFAQVGRSKQTVASDVA